MSELSQLIASAQDAPAAFSKESAKGERVVIAIEAVSIRQTRDPKTNKAQSWDDGSPMQQIVIVGADTTSGEVKTVYVKWWGEQRKKFADAILAAGATEPEIGALLSVTYEGEGKQPDNKAMSKPKLYSYAYNSGQ